ncbi:hypothetical protein GCM10027347_02550 [Larkinella harenae]
MKTAKLTLFLMLAILSGAVAQTEKGRWLVGAQVGNVSYQKIKDNRGHIVNVNVNPTGGYFLMDNFLVGVTVPFSSNTISFDSPASFSGPNTRSIGIGPFVRYYVGKSAVKPYLGVDYTYNRKVGIYNNINSTDYRLKGSSNSLAPTLGVAYFINRHILLSAGLNYTFTHSRDQVLVLAGTPSITEITANGRKLALDIGFALLLGQ